MVVNDKGLVRVMRSACKKGGGGYMTAMIELDGQPYIMVNTGFCAAVIEQNNMPRKALGLIVEHVGKIPDSGEAYRVKHSETQDMIFATAVQPILDLIEQAIEYHKLPRMKLTRLTWDGMEVWQREKDMQISMYNPEYTQIADMPSIGARMVGSALYVGGDISMAFIMTREASKADKHILEHLSQMQWA